MLIFSFITKVTSQIRHRIRLLGFIVNCKKPKKHIPYCWLEVEIGFNHHNIKIWRKKLMEQIEIKIIKKWPQDDIIRLYKAGGWWKPHYKKSGLQKLIEQSYAFAVVIHKPTKKTIGMGRIISDKTSDAYIQDLIILPEYRGKGYGRQLVKKLIEHCVTNKLHWIGLIAEPNQDEFYKKIGFKKMEKYVPMLYETEE